MASMKDEVITMPDLTFGQWETILSALWERRISLFRESVQAEQAGQPRKKEVLRKMSNDCAEIRAIIFPVIEELEELWG